MPVRRLEDIEKEKHNEKRDKIAQDINYVIDNVFKKPKKDDSLVWFILKLVIGFISGIIIINLILGNIWLLQFFWKEFF